MQPNKQCISEREEQLLAIRPPLSDENDEILWCELLDRGESVIEEWNGVDDDHQDVATELLVQGVARRGDERGATVHVKSLIWAAKNTEWKKLGKNERCAFRPVTVLRKQKLNLLTVSFQVVLL